MTAALLLMTAAGCASDRAGAALDLAPPPERLGAGGGVADLETSAGTGIDARTVDDTADAPTTPVGPSGATGDEILGDLDGDLIGPRSAAPAGGGVGPPPLMSVSSPAGKPVVSAQDTGESEGYRTVGGVLAEVNGRPIYTDEVVAARRPELRGLAKRYGRGEFVRRGIEAVGQEVALRINDELSRLVSERNLRGEDLRRATLLTTQWRIDQITDAGGSEAVARARAVESSGLSLEKLSEVTHARHLGLLFAQTVLIPRATPSAEEVRDYFLRHREEFAEPGALRFLLIEVDAGRGADKAEQARLKAERVRERAAAGEDFESLAKSDFNDNDYYRSTGGVLANPEPLAKGSVAWPELEAELWTLDEGGVTPVVPVKGGRSLLVAKLIEKREPREADFAQAQGRINASIRDRRRRELLLGYLNDARASASITPPEQMQRALRVAAEVLEQEYDALRAE